MKRRYYVFLSYLTSVIVGACLVIGGLAIVNNSNKATDACTAANGVANGIISVLEDGQKQALDNPAQTIKEEQRQKALDFYANAIKKIKDSEC